MQNTYICFLNIKLTNMKKLFLIAIAAMTFSCSSDDSPSTNIAEDTPIGYAFIRGKMNNFDFDYTVNNTATDVFVYNSMGGYSGQDLKKWYHYGGSLINFNPPSFAPELSIAWEHVFYSSGLGADMENEQFYNSVSNLPTAFLTDNQQGEHVPGISINFKDAQGKNYSTIYGNQIGSAVTINGSSETVVMGIKMKTVWGTFSCKMYNNDNLSDIKQITNGTFKLVLSPNT